jgi:hypothetical protein
VVPSTTTVPLSGRSIAPMMCSNVDFPDPDAPVSATNSPAPTLSVTSSAAHICRALLIP